MLGVGHGHALRCSFGLSARKEQAKRTCELFPLGSVSVMFHAAVVSPPRFINCLYGIGTMTLGAINYNTISVVNSINIFGSA